MVNCEHRGRPKTRMKMNAKETPFAYSKIGLQMRRHTIYNKIAQQIQIRNIFHKTKRKIG